MKTILILLFVGMSCQSQTATETGNGKIFKTKGDLIIRNSQGNPEIRSTPPDGALAVSGEGSGWGTAKSKKTIILADGEVVSNDDGSISIIPSEHTRRWILTYRTLEDSCGPGTMTVSNANVIGGTHNLLTYNYFPKKSVERARLFDSRMEAIWFLNDMSRRKIKSEPGDVTVWGSLHVGSAEEGEIVPESVKLYAVPLEVPVKISTAQVEPPPVKQEKVKITVYE